MTHVPNLRGQVHLAPPKNVRPALNIVQAAPGREAGRRQTGAALESLELLAATFGPSSPCFLPTFLEDAAPIFLAQDNRTYAVQTLEGRRD